MRVLCVFLLLFATQLCANSSSSFGVGYRRDRCVTQSLSTDGILETSVKEHDVNSVVECYNLDLYLSKFLFGVFIDYGFLCTGKRTTENFVPDLPPLVFTAKLDSGYETDVFTKLGYAFALSGQDPSPFTFIPAIGYGFSRLSWRSRFKSPLVLEQVTPGINEQALFFDTASFRYRWIGPFLEGKFDFFFFPKWRLNFSYQFHILQGKTRQPLFLQMDSLLGDVLAFQRNLITTLRTTIDRAYKQAGEISISYLPTRTSAFRLQGTFSRCKSHKGHQEAYIKNQTFPTLSGSTFSVSSEESDVKQTWTNASVVLYADFLF